MNSNSSRAPTLPSGTLIGRRYLLDRPLGRGGMAEVYAAHDEVLDRSVAVKLLLPRFSDDEQFIARFRREAQQAASLTHPNVVGVYDTGDHEGLPFIVMELVRGWSLQDALADSGLTEERALEICAEVCSALHFAHERGLVHRDVKPGNILIAADGSVKVTDFGIARAIHSETVTQTAAVLGTAAYLSPEQAQGAAVDERTDVYSLGVVLYEALTGRQPFEGDSAVGVAYQHVQETPVRPRELNPAISAPAEAIAMRAMAKNPANRYQTAREMQDDLLRAHAGRSVAAPAVLSADETVVLDSDLLPGRPARSETAERRRRAVGYVVLTLLTIAAFATAVWYIDSLFAEDARPMRIVPQVRGLTWEDAARSLEARGLTPTFGGDEHSAEIAEGRVARQDPGFGEQIPHGEAVTLYLSRGPEVVTVPDVTNMPEEEALAELRRAGLRPLERVAEFNEQVERGRIIRTEPPANSSVPRGHEVTYVVSSGEEVIAVVWVVGFTEEDARRELVGAGFEPLVVREFSDSVDMGKVIRQDPQGGTMRARGSEVTIVVSRGRQETPTPTPSPSPTPTPTPSPTPSPYPSPSPTPSPAPTEDGYGRSAGDAPTTHNGSGHVVLNG